MTVCLRGQHMQIVSVGWVSSVSSPEARKVRANAHAENHRDFIMFPVFQWRPLQSK